MKIVSGPRGAQAELSMTVAVVAYGQTDMRSPGSRTRAAVVSCDRNIDVCSECQATYKLLSSGAVSANDGPAAQATQVVYASAGIVAALIATLDAFRLAPLSRRGCAGRTLGL
jgi:hypothetical protein